MKSSIAFILLNAIINNENVFSFVISPHPTNSFLATSQVNTPSYKKHDTKLYKVITGTKDTDVVNDRGGGVGLAIDNAIKIVGEVKYSQTKKDDEPSVNISPTGLLRYTKLTNVENMDISKVVCSGTGKELYKEPTKENPYEKAIYYAPAEAAKDAITKVSSCDGEALVINILGGEELMLNEAMDAVFIVVNKLLVESGDTSVKSITFNSLCDSSVPKDVATVSVLAVADAKDGEFYSLDGKWITVMEEDINPAEA